jgi:uncharacterized protein (DUF58 family)
MSWFDRLLSLTPKTHRTSAASDLVFPPDFLASLERLRLVALKALGGGLREGHRLGAYKGGQLEFHGHRSYSPGDELRYVDWNTYARLGKPYVKEFAREEAGVLHILLDATPSMSLGYPSKWTFARRIAALFAHVAYASKDSVYLYIFRGDGTLEQFPKRGTRGGIKPCMNFLEKATVDPAFVPAAQQTPVSPLSPARSVNDTVLGRAVSNFLKSSSARGRAIVISDFWQNEDEVIAALARLSSAGYDISGIHVLAPEEIQPDADGELLARSVEEDGQVALSASGDLSLRYTRELEAHRNTVDEAFKRRGGACLFERCDTSIEKVLIATLRQRRWVT